MAGLLGQLGVLLPQFREVIGTRGWTLAPKGPRFCRGGGIFKGYVGFLTSRVGVEMRIRRLCLAVLLCGVLLVESRTSADTLSIGGAGAGGSAYEGTVSYETGVLTIFLRNLSSDTNGNFLTGFVFNITGDATAVLDSYELNPPPETPPDDSRGSTWTRVAGLVNLVISTSARQSTAISKAVELPIPAWHTKGSRRPAVPAPSSLVSMRTAKRYRR